MQHERWHHSHYILDSFIRIFGDSGRDYIIWAQSSIPGGMVSRSKGRRMVESLRSEGKVSLVQ